MSIRRRAWKTAKGEAREAWIVDYRDKIEGGARRLKTFSTKKAALAFEATARVEVRQGVHTAASESLTVSEAGKLWLATGESNKLERATLKGYRQHLDLHIRPYIGGVKLAQLTAPLVRDFEDRLAAGLMPNGQAPQPRSRAMVRKIRVSLSSILSDAMERGHITRNVVRDLRSTRRKGKERQAERRQRGKLKVGVDIPSPSEIKAIVGALEGRWRAPILTAIFTGLRASELRGLNWSSVDFDRRELHVRQRADRFNTIGAPKSESGERTVPLPPLALNALREWKLRCPKSKLDLVFPSSGGRIEHHSNIVSRGLAPAVIRAGVTTADGRPKYTGLHALRHFYASWCINRRVDGGLELPAKVVQERLGHSGVALTMDLYSHLFPRGDDSAELAAAERALLA
jgi:integrase